MRRGFLVICVLLLFAVVAAAQDLPKMEAFLGYSFVDFGKAAHIPKFHASGGSAQYVYNFNTWLGAVGDFGAVHSGSIGGGVADATFTNFLFGPRVSFQFPRLRPYIQVLCGGVYATSSAGYNAILANPGTGMPPNPTTVQAGSSQTAFAMTAGGGLDIKINKHLMLRPLGLDYYMTRLQNLRTQGDNTQDNFRYTAGLVFTFGKQ
jgi:opacity protein-like surface antigen